MYTNNVRERIYSYMNAISATEARKHFFEVVKDTISKHETHYIHHKDGDVVLLPAEDYESLQETLELLSIPDFKNKLKSSIKDIEENNTISFDKVFKSV
jgi:antitoxin YefM